MIVAYLLRLPAAATISSDDMARLMQAALQRNPATLLVLGRLLELPAALQLSKNQIVQFLRLTIDPTSEHISALHAFFERLCSLPAAATISSDDVEQLLQEALQCKRVSPSFRYGVCQLPAAVELSADAIVRLLRMTIDPANEDVAGLHEFVDELFRLPAAATISSDDVEQLLQEALQCKRVSLPLLDGMFELPAAVELSADPIARVLHTFIDFAGGDLAGLYTSVDKLCRLPAAATISRGDMAQLGQAALQRDLACLHF
ncbi:hypothetical protein COO60DRAFT_959158 [Scenedesmus sp. NREL 46B-D3]|nr:hypothetical protein COO60DRAFT_959158 [Scenedesmus sp. NREL 46B-D3]